MCIYVYFWKLSSPKPPTNFVCLEAFLFGLLQSERYGKSGAGTSGRGFLVGQVLFL